MAKPKGFIANAKPSASKRRHQGGSRRVSAIAEKAWSRKSGKVTTRQATPADREKYGI